MKIAVNGNIIDTKKIYNITPIEKSDNTYTNRIKETGNQYDYLGYSFEIKFLNKKSLTINCIGDNLFPRKENYQWNDWYKEDYEKKYELLRLYINEFRNSIIKIWLENQSNIPQFNLTN
jgi:hypothetical protein